MKVHSVFPSRFQLKVLIVWINQRLSKMQEMPRSGPSIEKSHVRFVNTTTRNVDVFWIDYSGKLKKYMTCKPRVPFICDTFVGHPWVAFDSETLDQLVLDKKFVFQPPPTRNPPDRTEHVRKSVFITLPVFTLRQRALQVVRDRLTNIDDVQELGLPVTLQDKLSRLISIKYSKLDLVNSSCSCYRLYVGNILAIS